MPSCVETTPDLRRAHFVEQLHDLLERPADAANFRWTADGVSFEISETQSLALYALSPKWSFRSLASFIRQLSYYGFVRLSDRRKTQHRRGASGDKIVFFHPSGFFTRGDNSRLEMIQRKPRDRSKSAKTQSTLAVTNSNLPQLPPTYSSLPVYSPSKSSLSDCCTPVTRPVRSPRRPQFGRASTWNGSSGQLFDGHAGYSTTPDLPRYSYTEAPSWTTWAGDLHLPEPESCSRPLEVDNEAVPLEEQGNLLGPEAPYWSAWARSCGATESTLAHVVPSMPAGMPNGLTMRGFDEYRPMLTPPALVDDSRRRGYFDVASDIYSTGSSSVPQNVQAQSADPGYAARAFPTSSDPQVLERPHRLRTVPLPSSPLCGLGLHFDGLSAGGGRSRTSPSY